MRVFTTNDGYELDYEIQDLDPYFAESLNDLVYGKNDYVFRDLLTKHGVLYENYGFNRQIRPIYADDCFKVRYHNNYFFLVKCERGRRVVTFDNNVGRLSFEFCTPPEHEVINFDAIMFENKDIEYIVYTCSKGVFLSRRAGNGKYNVYKIYAPNSSRIYFDRERVPEQNKSYSHTDEEFYWNGDISGVVADGNRVIIKDDEIDFQAYCIPLRGLSKKGDLFEITQAGNVTIKGNCKGIVRRDFCFSPKGEYTHIRNFRHSTKGYPSTNISAFGDYILVNPRPIKFDFDKELIPPSESSFKILIPTGTKELKYIPLIKPIHQVRIKLTDSFEKFFNTIVDFRAVPFPGMCGICITMRDHYTSFGYKFGDKMCAETIPINQKSTWFDIFNTLARTNDLFLNALFQSTNLPNILVAEFMEVKRSSYA